MKDVLAYPDKPWDWECLSANPGITMKDVLAYPDKPWDWWYLSTNKFLYHPTLQSRAIKRLNIIRTKRRANIKMKILKSSMLYNDLIGVISDYGID